ncbi:MAG: cysteine hydrolase [Parvularculaceae bacterium]|nr:MAG: cysteine hydrolase [Parvularculaceae bacterium]
MNCSHVLVIEKRASSAFEGTTLGQTLNDERIRTIIVCGLQSEHCVLNTALDAMRRGMKVYVASDAHSTWPDGETSATETLEQINKELAESGALVAPTQAIVSMLQSRP